MNRWSKLHRAVDRIAALFCRHEAGTVCVHNRYAHDIRYAAYIDGWGKATEHASNKATQ